METSLVLVHGFCYIKGAFRVMTFKIITRTLYKFYESTCKDFSIRAYDIGIDFIPVQTSGHLDKTYCRKLGTWTGTGLMLMKLFKMARSEQNLEIYRLLQLSRKWKS